MKVVYWLKAVLVALLVISQVEMPVKAYGNPQKVVQVVNYEGLNPFEARTNEVSVEGITDDSVIEFIEGFDRCGFLPTEEFFDCAGYEYEQIEGEDSFVNLDQQKAQFSTEAPIHEVIRAIVFGIIEAAEAGRIEEDAVKNLVKVTTEEIRETLTERFGEVPPGLEQVLSDLETTHPYHNLKCLIASIFLFIGCIFTDQGGDIVMCTGLAIFFFLFMC